MLKLTTLTLKSLKNRRLTVGLTIVSIALSVALLLGVERIRKDVHTGFIRTVSGTDLIVGARTGSLQLLLSSVFRIGNAPNNMAWESYTELAAHPSASWTIPISLGDSHQGYRVLGTNRSYFEHLRYGHLQPLEINQGDWFASDQEAVIGAEAAKALGYTIGDQIIVAHGAGDITFIEHDDHPFTVVGILKPTGTPVDRTIHVDLSGITAIHAGINGDECKEAHDPLHICESPRISGKPAITAVFVGLNSRAAALSLQRTINAYDQEALSAILPGLALQELWEIVGLIEKALLIISFMVIAVGLCGMLAALMTSLQERRREMAILRSVGARPGHVLALITGESVLITACGVFIGFILVYALIMLLHPLANRIGIHLSLASPTGVELVYGAGVIAAGLLTGFVPAYRSYRYSLSDGLTMKV